MDKAAVEAVARMHARNRGSIRKWADESPADRAMYKREVSAIITVYEQQLGKTMNEQEMYDKVEHIGNQYGLGNISRNEAIQLLRDIGYEGRDIWEVLMLDEHQSYNELPANGS